MKNKIIILIISLLFCVGMVSVSYARRTPNFFFNQDGDNLILTDSNWELGATGDRIAKIWATAIDVTNILIGGTSTGNIDMGGYDLINTGKVTGEASTSSLTLAGGTANATRNIVVSTVNAAGDAQLTRLTFGSDADIATLTFTALTTDFDAESVINVGAAGNDFGVSNTLVATTITGVLTADTGTSATTLQAGNGSAAQDVLILKNDDETATAETGQTTALSLEMLGSIDSGSNFVAHEAARIEAYKVSDWFHASDESDHDAGLKFYTTNGGVETLALTIDNAQATTFGNHIYLTGTDYVDFNGGTSWIGYGGVTVDLNIEGNGGSQLEFLSDGTFGFNSSSLVIDGSGGLTVGGDIAIAAGANGTISVDTDNTQGDQLTVVAGSGGTGDVSGGALNLTGGAAGSGGNNVGGAVYIAGGVDGVTSIGGAVYIRGGAGNTNGIIYLGDSNTASVNVGVALAITGITTASDAIDITIADANDNVGLTLTNNNTTNNPNSMHIANATTGRGLYIDQNGNGRALHIDKENTATTGSSDYGIYNDFASSAIVTGTNNYLYGQYNTTTKSGLDTNADTTEVYGIYQTTSNVGSTDTGTRKAYGGYFSTTGSAGGTSTAYGVYSTATGSDTNYSFYGAAGTLHNVGDFYAGGTVSFADYTRTVPIPATTARVGVTAPTVVTIVNTRGLGFDADAEIAFIAVPVPSDWNGTSDLTLKTAFCGTAGDAIANGEKVTLDISFNSVAAGEAVDNGTEKTATATHTSTGDADKELIILDITIDYDNADQPLTAGDALFIKFNRDVTAEAGNTYSGMAIVQKWALQYTSNAIPK